MNEKMKSDNLIRIQDLDTPLYRIFPLNRVEELFANRELVLVSTKKWEDPFENFLLRCNGKLEDGTLVSLKSLADSWFGQCWTTNPDTDAMWRIYSHDKQSIRLKTTIRKLAKVLWNRKDKFASLNYFIGRVQYLPREEIETFLSSSSFNDVAHGGQNNGFANLLLTKRKEFEHESEVRMLAHVAETKEAHKLNGLYRVSIDPHELIEEVCIDPRLVDELDVECLEKKIARTGYKGRIMQSELYKLKITTIDLSPTA